MNKFFSENCFEQSTFYSTKVAFFSFYLFLKLDKSEKIQPYKAIREPLLITDANLIDMTPTSVEKVLQQCLSTTKTIEW